MKIFVGVTDNDWFRFLEKRRHLDEVNFWQPSGKTRFRALEEGEVFLFKLHAPENFIVGGGFFAHFSLLGYRRAWEWFGEKNGVGSLEEMRRRISKYRRQEISPFGDATVGCIMLSEPFFFPYSDWIPVPGDFSRNIVKGKTYDSGSEIGSRLWEEVRLRIQGFELSEARAQQDVYGEPRLIRPRLGQGTFRSLVADVYRRRCAISGEKALPVLDAAHIKPVSQGGKHETSNGLLFRADIHRLFDGGYVTVEPNLRFRVSSRLKTEFDNGEPYYPLEGLQISLPDRENDRPNREFLEWHSETVFRA